MKHTKEILQAAAARSSSLAGVLRELGFKSYSGSTSSHIRRRLDHYGIDTSHFTGLRSNLGKVASNRKKPEDVFRTGYEKRAKTDQLRRALLESGVPYECALCHQEPVWCGKPLLLPIDHVDGDWSNNLKSNLRFLCPNCHSQTGTFGSGGKALVGPCVHCGRLVQWNAKREGAYRRKEKTGPLCSLCHSKHSQSFNPTPKEKGAWPSKEELARAVWEKPATVVAKEIGVSSSALKKRCNRLGIATPPRGYWSKGRSR